MPKPLPPALRRKIINFDPTAPESPPITQFCRDLIPPVIDTHPLGCHRPRISDRIIFDKLIAVLVLGASYAKIADSTCSATTLRTRRDEWIAAGIFDKLEQICLEYYDRIIGLDLENLSVDGCIIKAPCGGEAAGKSPVDRGKLGTKRSLMVDGGGMTRAFFGNRCSYEAVPQFWLCGTASFTPATGN